MIITGIDSDHYEINQSTKTLANIYANNTKWRLVPRTLGAGEKRYFSEIVFDAESPHNITSAGPIGVESENPYRSVTLFTESETKPRSFSSADTQHYYNLST